jgi:prepilin signal peptidase PulO-like enzyme (type II secretory pathway)
MHSLFLLYAFIFGCMIGSFLNVVIYRLPLGKNLVATRSACPACGTQLAWYHNIPLLSWMALRGRCGFCRTRISWRYPLIELLTGLFAFWLFPETTDIESMGLFVFYFVIACIFLCHLFIDLDHHLLLDSLNLYLLGLVLPFAIFTFTWPYWLLGAAIGFGGPLAITWLFYKIRGQVGLGGGDIKLYGILGLYLGPTGIIFNIFMSCFLGAIVGIIFIATKRMSREHPMAFGPSILAVAALQIFFPEISSKVQAFFF